ncbi:C40 family peptidase [Actinoplanes aureus]|uniref:C40 family peptidase n=1 Tax=Actinoplanes aureus TaxID=2792083 RepID=UPI001E4ED003|nr:NlpC/P60 family protein [Actinoplanes aureus]
MTAGAIALAVIAPALEPVEHAAEAVTTPPRALPATPELPALPLGEEIQERQFLIQTHKSEIPLPANLQERVTTSQRASRSIPRRPAVRATARVRPVVTPASRRPIRLNNRPAARVAERPAARHSARTQHRRVVVQQRRTTVAKRGAVAVRKVTRSTAVRRLRTRPGRSMGAVIAFARSQVGKRYVRGGEGPGGFDCSGFTRRAYARAGLRLPHSSGAQARRARTITRSQARPGDLVVGPGHVGIYMGRGMMIDAGNHRTGVVYRKLYRGLRVARL